MAKFYENDPVAVAEGDWFQNDPVAPPDPSAPPDSADAIVDVTVNRGASLDASSEYIARGGTTTEPTQAEEDEPLLNVRSVERAFTRIAERTPPDQRRGFFEFTPEWRRGIQQLIRDRQIFATHEEPFDAKAGLNDERFLDAFKGNAPPIRSSLPTWLDIYKPTKPGDATKAQLVIAFNTDEDFRRDAWETESNVQREKALADPELLAASVRRIFVVKKVISKVAIVALEGANHFIDIGRETHQRGLGIIPFAGSGGGERDEQVLSPVIDTFKKWEAAAPEALVKPQGVADQVLEAVGSVFTYALGAAATGGASAFFTGFQEVRQNAIDNGVDENAANGLALPGALAYALTEQLGTARRFFGAGAITKIRGTGRAVALGAARVSLTKAGLKEGAEEGLQAVITRTGEILMGSDNWGKLVGEVGIEAASGALMGFAFEAGGIKSYLSARSQTINAEASRKIQAAFSDLRPVSPEEVASLQGSQTPKALELAAKADDSNDPVAAKLFVGEAVEEMRYVAEDGLAESSDEAIALSLEETVTDPEWRKTHTEAEALAQERGITVEQAKASLVPEVQEDATVAPESVEAAGEAVVDEAVQVVGLEAQVEGLSGGVTPPLSDVAVEEGQVAPQIEPVVSDDFVVREVDGEFVLGEVNQDGTVDDLETFQTREEADAALAAEGAAQASNLKALNDIDAAVALAVEGLPEPQTFTDIRRLIYEIIGVPPPSANTDPFFRIGFGRLQAGRTIDWDSTRVKSRIAREIFRATAEAEGLDADALLGPNSGLTAAGQKARLDDAAAKADAVASQMADAFGNIFAEPAVSADAQRTLPAPAAEPAPKKPKKKTPRPVTDAQTVAGVPEGGVKGPAVKWHQDEQTAALSVVSTRKASVEQILEVLGFPKVPGPGHQTRFDQMRLAREQGIPERALRLAAEMNTDPRPLSAEESVGMTMRMAELTLERKQLLDRIRQANQADAAIIAAEVTRMEAEIAAIAKGLLQASPEGGRSLEARKFALADDLTIPDTVQALGLAAKGSELTKTQQATLNSMSAQLFASQQEVADLKAKADAANAEKATSENRKARKKAKPKAVKLSMQEKADRIKKLLEAGC